jgi:hypothetical protein
LPSSVVFSRVAISLSFIRVSEVWSGQANVHQRRIRAKSAGDERQLQSNDNGKSNGNGEEGSFAALRMTRLKS